MATDEQEPAAGAAAPEPASVASTEVGSRVQQGVIGVALVGLVVAAAITLLSLASSTSDDADRLVIDDVTSTIDVPRATFDASIGDRPDLGRDITITDEPIVIDADGNIVDPRGGNGADTLPSEAAGGGAEPAELELPDDVFTAQDSAAQSATTEAQADGGAGDDGADDADDGINILGGDDPEDRRMPDLICRGLQAAQDEIQDRGVFGSKSKDATGEGRRQIWDRNWVVVAQDPAPGEKIGEFEAILYVVKKSDDENFCD